MPASDIIFWGIPYSANIILTALVRFFQSFDDGKFAVVIYNTQIVFIIKMEYVCPDYLPWSEGYIMMEDLFLRLHLLKFKIHMTLFYVFFNISIYAGPVHTFMGQ